MIHEDERAWITVNDSFSATGAIAESDAIIAYTCNVLPTDRELDALEAFLSRGGRLFALHATNALLSFTDGPAMKVQGIEIPGKVDTTDTDPRFTDLLGSRLLAHLLLGPVTIEVSRPDSAVHTPMTDQVCASPEALHLFAQTSPLGRIATADEIAAAALWLASDECFMTGENLQVSGGLPLRRNPTKGELTAAMSRIPRCLEEACR
jgi:ATP-dependent protease HslVU (ClpYQ) peptidase subunit